MSSFTRAKLADVMEEIGKLKLTWKPVSEADKFKKKFWPVFGKGKWSWCAATVTYACEQAGLPMPVKAPSKFGYTFALVEAWQQWAIEQGFYTACSEHPDIQRGDIICFDWDKIKLVDKDVDWENHIGVAMGPAAGSTFPCAEGNAGNKTAIKTRKLVNVEGIIRVPDGYEFPKELVGEQADASQRATTKRAPTPTKAKQVAALQRALNNLGADLKADGIAGPLTQAAMLRVAKELE